MRAYPLNNDWSFVMSLYSNVTYKNVVRSFHNSLKYYGKHNMAKCNIQIQFFGKCKVMWCCGDILASKPWSPDVTKHVCFQPSFRNMFYLKKSTCCHLHSTIRKHTSIQTQLNCSKVHESQSFSNILMSQQSYSAAQRKGWHTPYRYLWTVSMFKRCLNKYHLGLHTTWTIECGCPKGLTCNSKREDTKCLLISMNFKVFN